MITKNSQNLLADCEPKTAILLSVLSRAKADARLGSLEAAAWLVTTGIEIAEAIAPNAGTDKAIVELCKDVLAQVDAGRLKARWGV